MQIGSERYAPSEMYHHPVPSTHARSKSESQADEPMRQSAESDRTERHIPWSCVQSHTADRACTTCLKTMVWNVVLHCHQAQLVLVVGWWKTYLLRDNNSALKCQYASGDSVRSYAFRLPMTHRIDRAKRSMILLDKWMIFYQRFPLDQDIGRLLFAFFIAHSYSEWTSHYEQYK